MKVSIFGTGYVGLVTGACLAEAGVNVLCIDTNRHIIKQLKNGQIPIHEPGLESLVQKESAEGRLQFSDQPEAGVAFGDFLFISVGTPPDEDGSADLKHVLDVAATIGEHLDTEKLVVTKSTVPVGTGDKVRECIQNKLDERAKMIPFHIVSNPEFLKEGAAIADARRPDRLIIGCDSKFALEKMKALYAPFNRNHEKVVAMDIRSAELTKYAANSMLASRISLMNELANIAELTGADIEKVRLGIGSDPRIGYQFIYPGAGFGGSCFPKDVSALTRTAREFGYDARMLAAIEEVNYAQKRVLFTKIQQHFKGQLKGLRIALWGLAFKPNTDDMREASSRVLMEALWKEGVCVQAYDPVAMQEAERLYGLRDDLILCPHQEDSLENADALVVMTEWKAFWNPDFDIIKNKLKQAVIFDGRNIYDPAHLNAMGFCYYGIGRPAKTN